MQSKEYHSCHVYTCWEREGREREGKERVTRDWSSSYTIIKKEFWKWYSVFVPSHLLRLSYQTLYYLDIAAATSKPPCHSSSFSVFFFFFPTLALCPSYECSKIMHDAHKLCRGFKRTESVRGEDIECYERCRFAPKVSRECMCRLAEHGLAWYALQTSQHTLFLVFITLV